GQSFDTAAAPPAEDEGSLGDNLSDYQAGRSRRLQVTSRGWNRFDKAKRQTFLEWFAATCNAKQAARRAGVAYSTVYRHRMEDARFAAAWDLALEQGYARLEAKLLEMMFEAAGAGPVGFDGGFEPPSHEDSTDEAGEAAGPSTIASSGNGPPPHPASAGQGGFDAPDPRLADPEMAMQLLRQHKSEVGGIRSERDNSRARGRIKEV